MTPVRVPLQGATVTARGPMADAMAPVRTGTLPRQVRADQTHGVGALSGGGPNTPSPFSASAVGSWGAPRWRPAPATMAGCGGPTPQSLPCCQGITWSSQRLARPVRADPPGANAAVGAAVGPRAWVPRQALRDVGKGACPGNPAVPAGHGEPDQNPPQRVLQPYLPRESLRTAAVRRARGRPRGPLARHDRREATPTARQVRADGRPSRTAAIARSTSPMTRKCQRRPESAPPCTPPGSCANTCPLRV